MTHRTEQVMINKLGANIQVLCLLRSKTGLTKLLFYQEIVSEAVYYLIIDALE